MKDYRILDGYANGLMDAVTPLLPSHIVKDSRLLFDNREYGVALELICENLFENEVVISWEIYGLAEKMAQEMSLRAESWKFIEVLVRC